MQNQEEDILRKVDLNGNVLSPSVKENEECSLSNVKESEKVQESKKQNKKDLFWEIFRFLLVGGLATVVDWAVCFVAEMLLPEMIVGNWHVEKSIATTCGFTIGLIVNYILSIVFVYKHKKDENEGKSVKDFIIFTLIGVFTLGVSYLGVYLISDVWFKDLTIWIVSSYMFARAIMTAIGLVINYIGRKILIFK